MRPLTSGDDPPPRSMTYFSFLSNDRETARADSVPSCCLERGGSQDAGEETLGAVV